MAQPQKPGVKTLVIDNWSKGLTRYQNGDANSGFSYFNNSWGFLPFAAPGQLTWQETPLQIDAAGSVITDLIMCGKERVESGISYVYAVGHTGRVYKIQVNNPSTYNANYDVPVLLTTLTASSPTFTRGGFIEFYGATERMYIGSDIGVTQLNFDGTGETFVGSVNLWVQNVPRPMKQFQGVLYIGNGANIAKIDGTLTVVSYTWLSPGFPSNTQCRDMDITPDGNYLSMVVSRITLPSQIVTTPDTTQVSSSDSYTYKWNGSDQAPTSYNIFPSYSLTANKTFGNSEYNFGYDTDGAGIYNPVSKVVTLSSSESPSPNAIISSGNILGWASPESNNGFYKLGIYQYGSFDEEIPVGIWRQLEFAATGNETDIIGCPFSLLVSNFNVGSSISGYTNNLVSLGKVYYSTLEASSNTTKYKLYKFYTVSSGVSAPVLGTYQTQTQILGKKVTIAEVRMYGAPWVANNSFSVSIIGSGGTTIAGTSKTFTVGTNLTAGQDMAQYNPAQAPTYAIGVSIANLGTANFTLNKIEIDYQEAGK